VGGWYTPTPGARPGPPAHPFAEIVLLIGSDPRNLRNLGGEVMWGMGEGEDQEIFALTKTTAIYVPANLSHAPLVFSRVDRPILNIAIGLSTGDYA
jgi:hypothetical protein